MDKEQKILVDMKLHDRLIIGEKNLEILRVAGGWIYKSIIPANDVLPFSAVFVPMPPCFEQPF